MMFARRRADEEKKKRDALKAKKETPKQEMPKDGSDNRPAKQSGAAPRVRR